MSFLPCRPLFAALCAVAACLAGAAAAADRAADPVLLRFATVGDSRQDSAHPDPAQLDARSGALTAQDAHWLQNSRAFGRILREIGAQRPQLLFFNGDMIMGYGRAGVPPGWGTQGPSLAQVLGSDLVQTTAQYAFWRGMVAPLLEAGTYVVPVPGNHEIQCNGAHQTDAANQLPCPSGKHAQAENEAAWAQNMGDLIIDQNRFLTLFGEAPTDVRYNDAVPGLDGQTTDQSKLTFSFDFRGSHFAVITTDAVGATADGRSLDSQAPTRWLAADLAAAKARGARRFYVFGHKPAFTYDHAGDGHLKAGGLDADPGSRDAFWSVIESYGATYFCGHQHIYHVDKPRNGAYQVIVGSGGSPFDVAPGATSLHPDTDRAYAWATISVHRSGRVELETWGFSDVFGATRRLARLELSR